MKYEYEEDIKGSVDNIDFAKEVHEIYEKAKAWDNYVSEVRERVKITVNTDDDIEKETQEIIDYYMEDDLDGESV